MAETAAVSRLAGLQGTDVLPASVVRLAGGLEIGAGRSGGADVLLVAGSGGGLDGFQGEVSSHGGSSLLVGRPTAANLARLRELAPWLRPKAIGLARSFGFGDRLGLATPGHVRALRQAGEGVAAVFAQQSIREMTRTRRSPQQVLDDATWGAFSAGWREGFGADADHLKTVADVDACAAAGYVLYTFDPGDHVQAAADGLPAARLDEALAGLPWAALEDSASSMLARYRKDARAVLGGLGTGFDEEAVARAAVKYGRAVAHVGVLYRRLQEVGPADHEVEVSVDETDTPTTPLQHLFVASEMARLGIRWTSLAPRFAGRFEKGVDYIGDVAAFEADCSAHAAVARRLGPYKLSLHSGSDKLSVYPAFRRAAGDLAHIKTAGTSYLEALRAVSRLQPELFRQVCAVAWESFGRDRASYHISAVLSAAPRPDRLADAELSALLEDFHARQVLHVTFGTVLEALGDQVEVTLRRHREEHESDLERHFVRHLAAFTGG